MVAFMPGIVERPRKRTGVRTRPPAPRKALTTFARCLIHLAIELDGSRAGSLSVRGVWDQG